MCQHNRQQTKRSKAEKKRCLQAVNGCLSTNNDYNSEQIQADNKQKLLCFTNNKWIHNWTSQLSGVVLSDTALCWQHRQITSINFKMGSTMHRESLVLCTSRSKNRWSEWSSDKMQQLCICMALITYQKIILKCPEMLCWNARSTLKHK